MSIGGGQNFRATRPLLITPYSFYLLLLTPSIHPPVQAGLAAGAQGGDHLGQFLKAGIVLCGGVCVVSAVRDQGVGLAFGGRGRFERVQIVGLCCVL